MIFNHWMEGGPLFMSLIYLMWVAVLVLSLLFLVRRGKAENLVLVKLNDGVLFAGSLGLLLGILGQVIGIFDALSYLSVAKVDVSAGVIAAGLRVSFIAPLYGMGLFIFSGIVWFIFRIFLRK